MNNAVAETSGYATPPPPPPLRRKRGRRVRWFILALFAIAALYGASPYFAFWRLTGALRSGDRDYLARNVDYRSLRQSLKDQIKAKIAETRAKNPNQPGLFSGLSDAFGPRLVDTLVDAYITPEGLAALLANPQLPQEQLQPPTPAQAAPAPSAAPAPAATPLPRIDFSRVRYAFFTGARDFLVDVEGTRLRFRFSKMRWQLKTVELQLGDINL